MTKNKLLNEEDLYVLQKLLSEISYCAKKEEVSYYLQSLIDKAVLFVEDLIVHLTDKVEKEYPCQLNCS